MNWILERKHQMKMTIRNTDYYLPELEQFYKIMYLIFENLFDSNDMTKREFFEHILIKKSLEIKTEHKEINDESKLHKMVCDTLFMYIEGYSKYYIKRYQNYKKVVEKGIQYSNQLNLKISTKACLT